MIKLLYLTYVDKGHPGYTPSAMRAPATGKEKALLEIRVRALGLLLFHMPKEGDLSSAFV